MMKGVGQSKEEVKEEVPKVVTNVKIPIVEVPKVELPKVQVPIVEAPKVEEAFRLFKAEHVKEDKSGPFYLGEVKEITRCIIIKNTGIMNFTKGGYMKRTDINSKVMLPELEVGKEFTCIVKINNLKNVVGVHSVSYAIKMKNEEDVEEQVGKVILTYEIVEKPKYSDDQITKAKQLMELFPGKELTFYCEAVKNCGKVSFEELIESFCVSY